MQENNKILIVDDEPKNLKILRVRLDKDYELKEVTSGEEALEVIEDFEPAIVLLDIMMKGIDGYEVARRIKENPKTKKCKVVLVSGKAMIEEKLEGYHAGAEDYITKPFNGEELRAKIEVFMMLYNLELKLENMNDSLEHEVLVRSEQLLKSERMAFVGMHAGEVVHNLKNPLAIIKGIIYKLRKNHPEIAEVEKIDTATNKMLDIVKDVLTSFNRDMKNDMVDIKVDDLIQDELRFLNSVDSNYKHNIETELNLNSQKVIHASSSHISQIIANLIKNSVESMLSSQEKKLAISTVDLKDKVCVKIVDTGEGISKENLEKIFTPLFTTKNGQEGGPLGNGLGLPYCKRMVESYRGEMKVSSKLGEGTEIVFTLPLKLSQTLDKAA